MPKRQCWGSAIAATCGLLHDLGNPPFGHSGEDAIQEWFCHHITESKLRELMNDRSELVKDFLLFEGNAQTLRIVAKLQILADFHGLNLTFGTLSALCKYTASSVEAGKSNDHAKSKTGYGARGHGKITLLESDCRFQLQHQAARRAGPCRCPETTNPGRQNCKTSSHLAHRRHDTNRIEGAL